MGGGWPRHDRHYAARAADEYRLSPTIAAMSANTQPIFFLHPFQDMVGFTGSIPNNTWGRQRDSLEEKLAQPAHRGARLEKQ